MKATIDVTNSIRVLAEEVYWNKIDSKSVKSNWMLCLGTGAFPVDSKLSRTFGWQSKFGPGGTVQTENVAPLT